jgi:hypothetical protein
VSDRVVSLNWVRSGVFFRSKFAFLFYGVVDVEFTVMVPAYNRANFGWYVSKHKTFSGIFLKSGSFDGTELIFPLF